MIETQAGPAYEADEEAIAKIGQELYWFIGFSKRRASRALENALTEWTKPLT